MDRAMRDRLRDRYARCFGCGPDNPIGLHLGDFHRRGDGVSTAFRPRPDHAGFDDTLHGGVIATALDEASAWAALEVHGVLVFTAKLEVRYRRPAPSTAEYRVSGTVIERRSRRLLIDAALSDDRGVVASSSGLFVVAESLG